MTPTSVAPTVLVFDSGVGSLSIGREIHARLPALNLVYALDSAGFPYGEWQEADLIPHICTTVEALAADIQPDLLVLACNSASTTVLPALRATLSIPVVGVVPAIKPAARLTRSGVFGLLATPGTISRRYTAELIREFAPQSSVIAVGSAQLAPAVEDYLWEGRSCESLYAEVADTFRQHERFSEMDTLILACTHFPLVSKALQQHFPGVALIDSGEAIARRVEQLLAPQQYQVSGGRQRVVVIGERVAGPIFRDNLKAMGISELARFNAR